MSLLKSKFNLCVMNLPKDFDLTEGELCNKLKEHPFNELSPSQDFGHGWVNPEDMFSTFELEDIVAVNNIIVGYRFDKKSVPAPLIKKLYMEKLKEEESREGRKLDKIEKKALKQECKAQLVIKALPSPKMVNCIFDMENRRIYLDAKSKTVVQNFQWLFRLTFGCEPTVYSYGLMEEEKLEDFLNYVWQNTDNFESTWFDGSITLNDEDKNQFKFAGPALEEHIPEISDFKKSRAIKNLNIGMALGDLDYSITLNNKNFFLSVAGTKIKHESIETAVLDNVDRIVMITGKLNTMVSSYLK